MLPLYGSIIILIPPWLREQLIDQFGFGTDSDTERLIEFAKNSGRVQFSLIIKPSEYVHLDYLEPIFKELKPPAGMILLIHISGILLSPFVLVCIFASVCIGQIIIDIKQHPHHRRRRLLG
jgi:hypothetical protein